MAKSPFPGMDPYLERFWRDVHGTLIVHARSALQRQLGSGLRARLEERLVIEHPWEDSRGIVPDERARERSIEIIDPAANGKVITIIEFLSPTNKTAGDGREQYLRKQEETLSAGINLVEIDLTRSGRRQLAYPVAELPPDYQTTYLTCVYRGFSTGHFEIYKMPLREPLPAIRVPLRDTDPDVALDLQRLVNQAYEEGAFDDIDYTRPPVPPLDASDASWAAELVRNRPIP